MTWLQLRLHARRDDIATLEDLLLASGAVAVTLEDNADQPVLEPGVGETPLWQQTRITGLYPADADMQAVLRTLPDSMLQQAAQRVEILEDKDWEREWIQHYRPMRFGRRLWVCPSWLEPPEPNAVNLLLDPGLAFGTGTHPTTALCLEQLDSMLWSGQTGSRQTGSRQTGSRQTGSRQTGSRQTGSHQTVVDYGCGSGILAIAALKLGAALALGVDNDPQALAASRDNAARNNIAPENFSVAFPHQVDPRAWGQRADLVIANILAAPLIDLSDTLLHFLKPGGTVLLSGLLQNQADAVCAHYAKRLPLHIAGAHDGWVCLRGNLATR
jgi:ribosomal protein L11 methyltransferase